MAKRNYLIEGVSGSGKSSVCHELARRGYKTVDGDRELAYPGDPETGERVNSFSHHNHIWDIDKVKILLEDQIDSVAFFCGGSRNFHKFIDKFDEVFVLDVDDETIKRRLAARGNNFGGKKEELELVLKLNKTKEDIPQNGIIIDAKRPLHDVVDEIVTKANSEKQ